MNAKQIQERAGRGGLPDIWKDEVYVDYRKTVMLVCEFANLPNLEDRVRAMAEDRQRLQAFVDRLRKTEDGEPIVAGMEVFSVSSHGLDIWDWIF
jgi:hypothetical protein